MLRRLIPALAIVLVAVTACSDSEPSTTADAAPTAGVAGAGCPELATGGSAVTFGGGDAHDLAGYVLGDGAAGVVLVHQSNGSLCQWLPYAKILSERGYRAFAIDVNGAGASPGDGTAMDEDVAAATVYLRGAGVRSVVLVGASMGGTAVLAAATKIMPAVDGVVALSAPAQFKDVDAAGAAARLAVPVLYGCSSKDTRFADNAQSMYAATPATTKRQLVCPADTFGHGVDLVDEVSGDERVRTALTTFLKEHSTT